MTDLALHAWTWACWVAFGFWTIGFFCGLAARRGA